MMLDKLLGLVPWYYRLAGIALLATALFGFGYVKGLLHEKEEFDIYKAKVEALGDAARRAALAKEAEQKQITTEVQLEHNDEVARLNEYYDRKLRDAKPGRRQLPAAPDCPGRTDGTAPQPAACPACPEPDPDFERSCALDAEQVMKLQDLLRRNNFPVR